MITLNFTQSLRYKNIFMLAEVNNVYRFVYEPWILVRQNDVYLFCNQLSFHRLIGIKFRSQCIFMNDQSLFDHSIFSSTH